MADWQPVTSEDDTPSPAGQPQIWQAAKVEDEGQHMTNFQDPQREADYQTWLGKNSSKDGFMTDSMDSPVKVDANGNSDMYDLRGVFADHSHKIDSVAGGREDYLDVKPWMLDQQATQYNPQVTPSSRFAKGLKPDNLGTWQDNGDGTRQWVEPGQKPLSATKQVMNKAADLASSYAGGVVDDVKHPEHMIDEASDALAEDVNAGGEALKGLGGGFHKMGEAANTVAGAVPVLYDTAKQMFTGKDEHSATDWWFHSMVDPLKDQDDAFELAKGAGLKDEVAHEFGDALSVISTAVLTGGESAPLEAGASGLAAGKQALVHGTKSMAIPATTSAIDTGQQVYEKTGDPNQAIKAAQVQWLVTAGSGAVPMGAEGNIIKRVGVGAGSGILAGETGRETMNQVLPQDMQTAYSDKVLLTEGLQGGLMGGIAGHDAQSTAAHEPGIDELLAGVGKGQPGPQGGPPALGGRSDWSSPYKVYDDFREAMNAHDRGDSGPALDVVQRAHAEADAADAAGDTARAKDMRDIANYVVRQTGLDAGDQPKGAAAKRADVRGKTALIAYSADDAGDISAKSDGTVTVRGDDVAKFASEGVAQQAVEDAKQSVDERRIDQAQRKRVDAMTPEEMRSELLTHKLTGIPNDRAYDESEKLPTQVAIDANSLKWINDEGGHSAGNKLLQAIGAALHHESPGNAYHISGDEFVVQAHHPEEAESIIARAKARLAGATIEMVGPKGDKVTVNGIGIAHGVGDSLETADRNLQSEKLQQASSGLRAERGQQPPGISRTPPEAGLPSEQGNAPSSPAPQAGQARVLGQDIERPAVPTDAQAKAGNYKKPTVHWQGIPIKVENAKGQYRKYIDARTGESGRRRMRADYGYIHGTEGADKDGLDIMMGPHTDADKAYVIDQLKPDKTLDEHKIQVGVRSEEEARQQYLSHYPKDWKGLGGITELSSDELKQWLKHGDHTQPIDRESVPAPKVSRRAAPDARHDSVLEYLARHQKGIDSQEAEQQGLDKADLTTAPAMVGIRRAFRKNGMSFDEAAEALHEQGYPVADERGKYNPNTLLDRISDELRGRKHFSTRNESNLPTGEDLASWRHAKTEEQLDGMSDQALAELEARLEREAIQAESREADEGVNDIPFALKDDFSLSAPGGRAGKQAERAKTGGEQTDLFGDKVAIQNEIAKVKAARDKKRNSGQDSLETGKADDLFSQASKQETIADRLAKVERELGLKTPLLRVKTPDRVESASASPESTRPKRSGMDAKDVRAKIGEILAKLSKLPGDVHVVQSFSDLRNFPQLEGRVRSDAIAFVDPKDDNIYFIADEIRSPQQAAELVAHEVIVHHGLRAAFGGRRDAEYKKILDGVVKAMPGEVRAAGKRYFGDSYDQSSDKTRYQAAEEALAHFSEKYMAGESVPAKIKRFIDRLHAMIRDWLRSVMGLPEKFDELYVKRTLSDLQAFLRRGTDRASGSAETEPAFATPKDTFYSGVAKAVDAAKREKGTGAEWEATLRNMPGVKAEEMQWMGIKDWLADRGRVTKAEVADYVASHQIALGEVMHGGEGAVQPPLTQEHVDAINKWMNEHKYGDISDEEQDMLKAGGTDAGDVIENLHRYGYPVHRLPHSEEPNRETKYHEYATPGGENYREMLMTIDKYHEPAPAPELAAFRQQMAEKYGQHYLTEMDKQEFSRNYELEKAQAHAFADANSRLDGSSAYKGPHWEHNNVLAHVRFDDRTGPNGEKILHIHEVQSDWHQAGRRAGYKEPLSTKQRADLERRNETSTTRMRELLAAGENDGAEWHANEVERLSTGAALRGSGVTGHEVPQAPFKTSWPELAMKRMLRMAAEHGYDVLSWDTGDTNAERYNMSHAVDTINARLSPKTGLYDMVAHKDGKIVREEYGLNEERLGAMIGKNAAQRVVSEGASHDVVKLTGADLKVGGHGMRAFYDDILPKKVQALVKKWGGSVEPGSVLGTLAHNGTRSVVDEHGGVSFTGEHEQIPAHMVKITPAMRDSVMEGQPMFALKRRGEQEEMDLPRPPDTFLGKTGAAGKAYGAVRRSVIGVANVGIGQLRAGLNPKDVNAESKLTAQTATAFLGELAQQKFQVQEHLQQFSRAMDQLSHQDQLDFIDAIETGKQQPIKAMQPAADALRALLDKWRDNVRSLGEGHLDNFIENYFPHYWRDESKAKSIFASIQGRRPMRGPATFKKQRVIPTTKMGIELGLTPITTNPLVQTLLKVNEMQRYISGVSLMRAFKETKTASGTTLAVFNPATKPVPEGWKKIDDPIARVSSWSEAERGFIERGNYIMPTDAARVINNHLGRSRLADVHIVQAVRVGANVLNSMQLGFSAFHLGFTTLDAMVSKNALAIERLMHGEPGRASLAFLEAATPAGAALNLMRGMKLMKAYADPAGATPEMKAIVKALTSGGGRAHMDRYFLAAQGVSPFRGVGVRSLASDVKMAMTAPGSKVAAVTKAIGSFPLQYGQQTWNALHNMWHDTPKWQLPLEAVGRVTRASSAIIMEHVVPLQKLGVFSDMASDWLRRHPNADPMEFTQAMQSSWRSVDNRLGEMVYDNKFWDRTFKDSMHIAIRAVGWNDGTIEEIGGAPWDFVKTLDKGLRTGRVTADDWGHKIPYVLALFITTGIIGSIMNRLLTGESPKELKDMYFPRTGRFHDDGSPERISLPSYVKDIVEYSQHPGATMAHKANPWISYAYDLGTNTDYFGHPIFNPDGTTVEKFRDWAEFTGKTFRPFALAGQKEFEGADIKGGDWKARSLAVGPFVGLTPAPGYITKPGQIEARQHEEQEKSWQQKLKMDLRAAQKKGDAAEVIRIRQRMQESRGAYGDTMRQQKSEQSKAKQEAKKHQTSGLIDHVGPLLDQGGTRAEMAQRIEAAGYPALAGLIGSLPETLRPQMSAALTEAA